MKDSTFKMFWKSRALFRSLLNQTFEKAVAPRITVAWKYGQSGWFEEPQNFSGLGEDQ